MRLQGHRKRRKVPEVNGGAQISKIRWTDYKTMRQYQSIGDQLDGLRLYGCGEFKRFGGGGARIDPGKNGHLWLTMEPKGAE